MLDILVILILVGFFYGGFVCGSKYKTLKEMWASLFG